VGTVNVTVRFNEEELGRLDDLAQRMNKTRSDVIRDLVNRFDEVLRQEVEKERKKWMMKGFVGALESAILDPEVILRFVRRNVDVLGFPDFLIGMVRVRNRVVLFSHHDRTGSQLLQLIRSRIEEEIRREEDEIEREEGEDEEVGSSKVILAHPRVKGSTRPSVVRVIPGVSRYKIMNSSGAVPLTARPAATAAVSKSGGSGGNGGAKATAATTVPENKKSATTGIPTTSSSANAQPISSNQRVSTNGSGGDAPSPVGQGITHGLAGDFITALITNLYHKHRDKLLNLIGALGGDPSAMAY
jgi:predicted transcriptional regulator